jgi:fluoride exporter
MESRFQTLGFIAICGALGCLARYSLSLFFSGWFGKTFPYGTLLVNLIGAFLIGFVIEFGLRSDSISPMWRLGIVTGFLGGLTTFSSFSFETLELMRAEQFFTAFINVIVSVGLSLGLTWLGIAVAKQF